MYVYEDHENRVIMSHADVCVHNKTTDWIPRMLFSACCQAWILAKDLLTPLLIRCNQLLFPKLR